MKPWLRDATSSTDREVRELSPVLPPRVMQGVRHDTASSQEEVEVLVTRLRRRSRPARTASVIVPALALAAAFLVTVPAAVAVFSAPSPSQPQALASLGLGQVDLHGESTFSLGPSITVIGRGTLSVDRIHDRGADVSIDRGVATFEVEPGGVARDLRVSAGQVQVQVRGTIFSVARVEDRSGVRVHRGEVAVVHDGQELRLRAGETWSTPIPVEREPQLGVRASASEPPVETGDLRSTTASVSPRSQPPQPAPSGPSSSSKQAGEPEPGSSVEPPSPCDLDMFSRACVEERLAAHPQRASERFAALVRVMERVGEDPETDRSTVAACNRFLEQHPDAAEVDDVRAFRVQAAFTGSRASEVLRWADAYLASAEPDHPRRAEVHRWRAVAAMRIDAIDAAQTGSCTEALPLLRELAPLEIGVRRDEANAWRGLCAHAIGASSEARRSLRQVREETLPASLRLRIQEVWGEL